MPALNARNFGMGRKNVWNRRKKMPDFGKHMNPWERTLLSILIGCLMAALKYLFEVIETGIWIPTLRGMLTTSLFGFISALATMGILLLHFVFSEVQALENTIKLPFRLGDKTSTEVEVKKIEIAQKLCEVLVQLEGHTDAMSAKPLALDALLQELEEQRQNLENYSRLQFISPVPRRHQRLEDPLDLDQDGFQLIESLAQEDDRILATVYTNSRLWWLKPNFAKNFFEFNLNLLEKGVKITRVFGTYHPEWDEDEEGTKNELMQLQADLMGMEIYKIKYEDFDRAPKETLTKIDHMLLMRGRELLPSVEWAVDAESGGASKIYHVFGKKPGLSRLYDSFDGLFNSGFARLIRVNGTLELDVREEEARRIVLHRFNDIIERSAKNNRT
jgi:hypothetical protein